MTRTTCNHDDGPEVEVNPPLIRRPTRRHVNWHANGYKTHDNHRRHGTMMPGQEFRVCSGCQPSPPVYAIQWPPNFKVSNVDKY